MQVGGTEWQCLSLLGHLDPARFKSFFVCLNHKGPLIDTLRRTGVPSEVIPFRGFRRPEGMNGLVRLATFMRLHQSQIVQAYGFYSNVPALLSGWIAGVPILIASRRDTGEFLNSINRLVERVIFRLADRVVVNAEAIRHGGCREAVRDSVTGFLVPPGDSAQFGEKILRLLQYEYEAARMGKAGRERVETDFSMPRMIDRFSSFYACLARKNLREPPRNIFSTARHD